VGTEDGITVICRRMTARDVGGRGGARRMVSSRLAYVVGAGEHEGKRVTVVVDVLVDVLCDIRLIRPFVKG
jgi:hypothetical protein